MNLPRIRLLARFREGPIVELWRGAHRNQTLNPNTVVVTQQEFSADWTVWLERPARDRDMIDRRFRYDAPTEEPEEADDWGGMEEVEKLPA